LYCYSGVYFEYLRKRGIKPFEAVEDLERAEIVVCPGSSTT
jgi:hypothetical protein